MLRSFGIVASVILFFTLFGSCATSRPRVSGPVEPAEVVEGLGPISGPHSPEDVIGLRQVLRSAEQMLLQVNRPTRTPYSKLFGSFDASAVRKFVEARVRGWSFDPAFEGLTRAAVPDATVANVGALLWQTATERPEEARKFTELTGVSLEEARHGYLYLRSSAFSFKGEKPGWRWELLRKLSALAREARHSDCRPEDQRSRCHYALVPCTGPKRVSATAALVCDSELDGPYAYGYAAAAAFAERCRDCGPVEVLDLKLNALESLLHMNAVPTELRERAGRLLDHHDNLDAFELTLKEDEDLDVYLRELSRVLRTANALLSGA